MPDILRLRFTGNGPAQIPVLGRSVEPEELVEVPGRILTDPKDLKELGIEPPADDCFLAAVGNPPEVRAFQTSLWRDETPVRKTKGE